MKYTRKKVVIAITSVLALSLGGVGLAYWTSSGSATSTNTTGTPAALTVTALSRTDALSPGDTAPLSGHILAPSKPTYVHSVVATVTGTSSSSCDASNFTISKQPDLVNQEVDSTGVDWSGGVLTFVDKTDTNQNFCQGVTVNISYAAA